MEICIVFRVARIYPVLDIFHCSCCCADKGICKRTDALPEVVLGILFTDRNGGGNAYEYIRQLSVGKRNYLCMDHLGQHLDVRRASCDDAKSLQNGINRKIPIYRHYPERKAAIRICFAV